MRGAEFSGFDWDQGNRQKCQQHGLSIDEIESVLANAESLIRPDPKHERNESRFLAIGRTANGRHAFVAFTTRKRGSETWLRPISARFMHKREIRKYEQATSGAEK